MKKVKIDIRNISPREWENFSDFLKRIEGGDIKGVFEVYEEPRAAKILVLKVIDEFTVPSFKNSRFPQEMLN